ncbi:putative 3-phosphoinositide dependent protein kinase-1 [Coniochaeta sp. 2T2.1]|nr:putative 3-phosphoinositide dependent protein kinase-1 [Coniochaeta sp. 2T2.1]
MNGDLSLSSAFGGLRIANPDDSTSSPAPSREPSLHQPHSPSSSNAARSPATSSMISSQNAANYTANARVEDARQELPAHLRSEPSRSSMYGLPTRSDSRSGLGQSQSQVPSRDSSRSYHAVRQVSLPPGSGPPGGPMPPRRSSKGMGGGYASIPGIPHAPPSSNPGFNPDAGPLASSEEWKDRGAAVGVRKEVDAEGRTVLKPVKKGVRDFNFGRVLGEGSYSTVYLATDRQTLREYAVKVLEKKHIIKEKKIKYVNIEKNTLNRLTEHPGIVRLYYTFQDETSLYYVLDLCSGGELLGVLKKTGTFDVECTRFYGAQILDAVEYMHSRGVIHRDLKPENVLLDDQMHIKITDFGTAKLLPDPRDPRPQSELNPTQDIGQDNGNRQRAASFVGTAEYVSPELLTDKSAGKPSDLWAFGCIIFQLLAGRPPFKGGSEYLTFQKIVNLEYTFPEGFPPAARDLVERCLVLDPSRRLTVEHIKNHEFFDGHPFGKELWRMKAPRLRPYHGEGHKKLSRFFGGSTTKKRQRLVMITSSGRIVLAPAGGDEKRAKQEISLLGPDCSWRTQIDAKGQTVWCVDTGGIHYTFEEPKSASADARFSADDWIEALQRAKDLAMSFSGSSYGSENGFGDMSSSMSSPASTLGGRSTFPEGFSVSDRSGRNQLTKSQGSLEDTNVKRNSFVGVSRQYLYQAGFHTICLSMRYLQPLRDPSMQPQYRGYAQPGPGPRPGHHVNPNARRAIGPGMVPAGPHPPVPLNQTQMAQQQAAAHQAEMAKRKSRKPTDKSMPDGVEECTIGDGAQRYRDLRDFERRLDATMTRKRLDIMDSLGRTVKRYKTLRIWISNTVDDQPWQATNQLSLDSFDFPASLESSYRVKVEGRLLDEEHDSEQDEEEKTGEVADSGDKMDTDATPKPMQQKPVSAKPGQRYRFSHFFKALTVDFDRKKVLVGTEATVEWKKPDKMPASSNLPAAADFDELTFKRNGDENQNITINLYRHEDDRFEVSPDLADIIDMREATRQEAIMGLWEYIKLMNLQEDEEKRNFRCDELLRKVINRDAGYIPSLNDYVMPHLRPLSPIKLPYTIRVDEDFHKDPQPTIYDVRVLVNEPLKAKTDFLQNPQFGGTLKEVAALDDQLALLIQGISASKAKHTFFTSMTTSPANFVRNWLSSQKRDIEVIMGEATRGGGEDATGDEWRRGGRDSVWATQNARESVTLLLAKPPSHR